MDCNKSKSVKMLRKLTSPESKQTQLFTDLTNFKVQPQTKTIAKSYAKISRPNDSAKRIGSPNNKSYLFNKTAFGTPYDKSTLLSYISTPNEKSFNMEKFKMIRGDQAAYNFKFRDNVQSTQDDNAGQDLFKVNLLLPDKKNISRYFTTLTQISQISKQFYKDLDQFIDRNKTPLYGIIGFETVPFNYRFTSLINQDQTKTLEQFSSESIKQINIRPCILKKPISYQSLQFSDFEIVKFLGSGGFSHVYLAKCKLDYQLCALKFIRKDSITTAKKVKMLENEKNILFTIKHENLIDLLYAFETKNYIVFGLEYCPNGNLYSYLQKVKCLSQGKAKTAMLQILNGLDYLHSNNILFRDIKLQNILFDIDGKLKITDFGLSKPDIDEDEITYSYCGSPEYMAPEMLAKSGHSYEVDFYALGILLYQLLFGRSPFYAPKKQDIFNAILHSQPKFPKLPAVSKQVKSLIKGLLSKNPSHRIGSLKGIKQITSHPWFKIQNQQPITLYDDLFYQNKNTGKKQMQEARQIFIKQQNDKKFDKVFFQQNFVNRTLCDRLKARTHKFKIEQRPKATLLKASCKRR